MPQRLDINYYVLDLLCIIYSFGSLLACQVYPSQSQNYSFKGNQKAKTPHQGNNSLQKTSKLCVVETRQRRLNSRQSLILSGRISIAIHNSILYIMAVTCRTEHIEFKKTNFTTTYPGRAELYTIKSRMKRLYTIGYPDRPIPNLQCLLI
jgi:hypothetical protein